MQHENGENARKQLSSNYSRIISVLYQKMDIVRKKLKVVLQWERKCSWISKDC